VECLVGKSALRADDVQRRSDLRDSKRERYLQLQRYGHGLRVKDPEQDGDVFDCGDCCAERGDGAEHQLGRTEFGTGCFYICRIAERERRNARLHMVDGFRRSSGRIGAFERRCYLRHSDGEWDLDVYGSGEGQRIARADGFGE